MFSQLLIEGIGPVLVRFGINILFPIMALAFVSGIGLRILIYYTVRRHERFAREFDKRVNRFLELEDTGDAQSFSMMTKRLLEKTFYEMFEVRDRLKRRNNDRVMALSDRVFLIRQGTAWLVRDTIKQIRHLKRSENQSKLLNITKSTFMQNPCFNRVLGLLPADPVNDILNVLPGLFVIAGIFGTFLGIVKGLPTLSGMNLNDAEQTKLIMDRFLLEISFAMNTSIMGIFFSVLMTIVNTIFSPEKVFVQVIDRFENSLELLWNRSNNNDWSAEDAEFDEHRDALEALAEQALRTELARSKEVRNADGPPKHRPGQKAS